MCSSDLQHSELTYWKPVAPSLFPLSLSLESRPKSVEFLRRSSSCPSPFVVISGRHRRSPLPPLVPIGSPRPCAPPHHRVRFFSSQETPCHPLPRSTGAPPPPSASRRDSRKRVASSSPSSASSSHAAPRRALPVPGEALDRQRQLRQCGQRHCPPFSGGTRR